VTCPWCRAENASRTGACTSCGKPLAGLQPGQRLAGRYEIRGLLGHGGMGAVYKAHDTALDETVAIKVLRSDVAMTPLLEQRFRAEIKLARRVSHRNVCRIHEYGEDGDLRFISMEYVEGADLKQILKRRGALPAEEAYEIALAVARALEAIHAEGIVHRDLKSPNIMVDGRGIVRLMDFGIAKGLQDESAPSMTATGMIVGTPEYMSPEQARGEKVDARSDVYAMGIVLYEILTGRVPFHGDTPIATILKHLQEPPPLDTPEARRIPVWILPVLQRALAKAAADRYETATQFIEELQAAHDGVRSAPRPPRRAPRPAGLTATAAQPVPAHEPTPAPTPVPARVRTAPDMRAAVPTVSHSGSMPAARAVASPARDRRFLALGIALLAVVASVVGGGLVVMVQKMSVTGPVEKTPAATLETPATTTSAEAPPTVATPTLSPPAPTPLPTTASPTPQPTRRRSVATTLPAPAATPAAKAAVPAASGSSPPSASDAAAGLLQLSVIPWGDVTVDGALVAPERLRKLALPPGSHVVRIDHPDYETLQRRVTIRPGETTRLTIDLAEDGVRRKR
jgi:serine/threonine-protein kinase